jgi:hypothetical protein
MDMKRIAALATLLLFAGCAVVQLPGTEGKQPWEVVKVSGQSGLNPVNGQMGMFVCAIDGQRLDGNGRGCPTDLVFLPGTHTLVLGSSETGIEDPEQTVTKDFVGGQVWEIDMRFDGGLHNHHAVLNLDHTVSPPAKP